MAKEVGIPQQEASLCTADQSDIFRWGTPTYKQFNSLTIAIHITEDEFLKIKNNDWKTISFLTYLCLPWPL
jgi:hypothetical protein